MSEPGNSEILIKGPQLPKEGSDLTEGLNRVVVPAVVELDDLTARLRTVTLMCTGEFGLHDIVKALGRTEFDRDIDAVMSVHNQRAPVVEAVERDLTGIHEKALPFFMTPNIKELTAFLAKSPKMLMCEVPLQINSGSIEDRLTPEIVNTLTVVGHNHAVLARDNQSPAVLRKSGGGQTTYTLVYKNSTQPLISDTRVFSQEDPDIHEGLVKPNVWRTMLPHPLDYPAFADACLVEIVTEGQAGKLQSAKLNVVATVVPIGTPYNLSWRKPTSLNPTQPTGMYKEID